MNMKTGFCNGKIYQGKGEYCSTLLIEDGKIVYAGNGEGVSFEDYEMTDLNGKTVIPGLNDSHMHLFSLAMTYAQAKIRDSRSKKELLEISKKFIEENPELVKNGLSARGFNNDYFTDGTVLPTCKDLDEVSTAIPVVLDRVCGHTCCVNSLALKMMDEKYGLDNLPEAEVVKGEDGKPNGVFTENSVFKCLSLVPPFDADTRKSLIMKAMEYLVSTGVTTVQGNDLNDFENDDVIKGILKDLYENDEALIRYYAQCCFGDDEYESFKRVLENDRYHLPYESDMIKIGPLKLYKDGSLGARTAQLYNDYNDEPGNTGIEVHTPEEMYEFTKLANEHGVAVCTHCIGDRAIDETADAYAKADETKTNPCRNTINHCQITDMKILNKIADNNILVSYQPIFLEFDLHMVEDRVGKTLGDTSYAYKTLKGLGVHTSYGTDCPIEDCNGFMNLHCAVNRTDFNNLPVGGYNPSECMSLEEAIDCYTYESAYNQFEEERKGLLKEGYFADLVVLEEDIFNMDPLKLKDVKPLMTIVNGKVVFKR